MSGQDAGPHRLAVLLSGAGRTMENLAGLIDRGELDAEIVLVIASRQCAGAEKARALGIATRVMPGKLGADELGAALRDAGAEWVALAGYLQLVPIPAGFSCRVVNIHPSLLPAHGGPGMYGDRVHAAVLAAGDTETGCTVHLCDSRYDTGPVLAQERCPVLPGDTVQALAARVFQAEIVAYPRALRALWSEHRRTEGRACG